jgi:hypothetical protein
MLDSTPIKAGHKTPMKSAFKSPSNQKGRSTSHKKNQGYESSCWGTSPICVQNVDQETIPNGLCNPDANMLNSPPSQSNQLLALVHSPAIGGGQTTATTHKNFCSNEGYSDNKMLINGLNNFTIQNSSSPNDF